MRNLSENKLGWRKQIIKEIFMRKIEGIVPDYLKKGMTKQKKFRANQKDPRKRLKIRNQDATLANRG